MRFLGRLFSGQKNQREEEGEAWEPEEQAVGLFLKVLLLILFGLKNKKIKIINIFQTLRVGGGGSRCVACHPKLFPIWNNEFYYKIFY
jgi:hypothetical protein